MAIVFFHPYDELSGDPHPASGHPLPKGEGSKYPSPFGRRCRAAADEGVRNERETAANRVVRATRPCGARRNKLKAYGRSRPLPIRIRLATPLASAGTPSARAVVRREGRQRLGCGRLGRQRQRGVASRAPRPGSRPGADALGCPSGSRRPRRRRRGRTRRSSRISPDRSDCRSMWATGNPRGRGISRPTPATPGMPGCSRSPRSRAPRRWRLAIRATTRPRPSSTGLSAARACADWPACRRSACSPANPPSCSFARCYRSRAWRSATYLRELGQDHRDDASNADLSRTRSRIRHDLLPRLEHDYNPRVAEALVRLGKLAAASEGALENRLRALGPFATMSVTHDRVELRRDRLLQLPAYLRAEVIRRVWRQAGWPEAGMSAIRWRRLAALARRPQVHRVSAGGGIALSTTGCGRVAAQRVRHGTDGLRGSSQPARRHRSRTFP